MRALFTGLLRYARNDKGEVRALFTGLLRYARNDKGGLKPEHILFG